MNFFSCVAIAIVLAISASSLACTPIRQKTNILNVSIAERVATAEYKKYTKKTVQKFQSRLIEDSDKSWVFGFENMDASAQPGSDTFVEIDKTSGRATVHPGK